MDCLEYWDPENQLWEMINDDERFYNKPNVQYIAEHILNVRNLKELSKVRFNDMVIARRMGPKTFNTFLALMKEYNVPFEDRELEYFRLEPDHMPSDVFYNYKRLIKQTIRRDVMGRFNYYAIVNGKDGFTGYVQSWDECKKLVKDVEGVKYKGFSTEEEANGWIKKTEFWLASMKVHIPKKFIESEKAPSKKEVRRLNAIGAEDNVMENLRYLSTTCESMLDELQQMKAIADELLEIIDDIKEDTEEATDEESTEV